MTTAATATTATTTTATTTTDFEIFISGLLARNEVYISEADLSASEKNFLEWLSSETIVLEESPTQLGGAFWVDRGWVGLTADPVFRTNFYPF